MAGATSSSQVRRTEEAAIGTDDHARGLRIHAVISAGEVVEWSQQPVRVAVGQPENGAASADAATAAQVPARVRRAVKISCAVHGQAGHGIGAVLSASKVVDHAEGLRLRADGHQGPRYRDSQSSGATAPAHGSK